MRLLRTLHPFLRPYRGAILLGLLLVVVANAFAAVAPRLLGLAIDAIGRPDATQRTVLTYAGLVILFAVAAGAARYGMRELLNGMSRRIETDLRDAFFEHLLRLDAGFHATNRTGDLMSRATNDTQAVRMAAGPGVMYLVNTLFSTAFALALMLRISPRLTALALVPLAPAPARRAPVRPCHPPPLRAHPGPPRRPVQHGRRRTWPACASSARTRRRKYRSGSSTR